jgi:hypothetical protein
MSMAEYDRVVEQRPPFGGPYFLRPQNGRLVVRNELRVGVKYDVMEEA